jgi:Xaa-Pro dipeptidase
MGLANHNLPAPPSGKYPAKAHARRVAEFIASNGGPTDGIIYLEAQKTAMVEVGFVLFGYY